MASTQNYDIPLPQLGEPADIRVLDQGTEKIDNIMHGNRTMIAPGWVSTETYNTGNRVVYLGEYYKCKADNVTGTWDATKWDKTTVGEDIEGLGTGGASALADLDDVEITNPTVGQALLFDDDDKWKNQTLPDPSVVKEVTGNPVEFTDGAAAPLVKCVTQITGYQEGTGTPSPDNIRPIVAYTEGEIEVSDISKESDYHTVDSYYINAQGEVAYDPGYLYCDEYIKVTGGKAYTFSFDKNVIQSLALTIPFYDANKNFKRRIVAISGTTTMGTLTVSFTVDDDCSYIRFSAPINSINFTIVGEHTTHTTTFPSAIYRGSEDVVNGSVIANMCVYNMTHIQTFTISSQTDDIVVILIQLGFEQSFPKNKNTSIISNRFSVDIPSGTPGRMVLLAGGQLYLVLPKDELQSVDNAGFIAWFEENSTDICYELATPTSASVTPTNLPIKSLSGYNHIESSTGEMEVEYISGNYQALVDLIQSSSHVYSTAEQVVGKWIDGSTVYEKTISTSSPSAANTNVAIADLSSCSINTLISIEGVMYVSSLSQRVPIFWSYNTAIMGAVYVDGTNLMQIVPNGYTGATEVITIRYTKTTQTRSLNAPVNTQKAQIEPLSEKEEETPVEEEKAVETLVVDEPIDEPIDETVDETEEKSDER